MKKHILSVLIAAATITAASAAPVQWSAGDVFMGFESVSLNKNVLFNLGAGSNLGNFTSLNAGADLTEGFGTSDWYNISDLKWGVFGIASNKTALWGSVASGNSALTAKASGALTTGLSRVNSLGLSYNGVLANNDPATQGDYGVYTAASGLSYGSWSGNSPTSAPFSVYAVSIESGVQGSLDVYSVPNSGAATALFKQANGNALTVDATGNIASVPEPSTYALCGIGALLLLVAYRRKVSA